MENGGSDDGLEDEDLEEGEILDSGGEENAEENMENLQQTNGISGQGGIFGGAGKRKNADSADQDEADGSQKKKTMRYVDHDQVMDDDDWTRGITFNHKRSLKYDDGILDYKRELAAYRGSPYSTPERSPNEDSLPGDKRSASPSGGKGKKKTRKLGALCRIKTKKSGGKGGKKRKPGDLKGRLSRQKRDPRHNRPLCKFYMEGKCAKGSECPFSHVPLHPRKKELCKFYLSGHCAKGKHCHFMHEEFPCKFYHTGAVCYSKESCRFSHKPLTEETKALLDKYLQGSFNRGDDDVNDDYYRERSKMEKPKVKRPCLLGSPPRHIREAAETKQWQEEMKMLQHQSKGRSAFEIQVSPVKEITSPSKFSRPNFYTDTLSASPNTKKRTSSGEVSDSVSSSKSYEGSNQHPFCAFKDENGDKDWTSICDMVNKLSPSVNDTSLTEKATIADPEFCETKEETGHVDISEGSEPTEESGKFPSPTMGHQDSESEESSKYINEKVDSPKEKTPVHISESYPPPEVIVPPINIPSHLPRKQRELFLRIQHNQKRMPTEGNAGSLVIPDTASEKSEVVKTECEINETTTKKDDYYSSEDDDDIDQPLTNVLKKLHETPHPDPKEKLPPTTSALSSGSIDIVQMIKSITQKASEKPQSSVYHEPESFWKNILSSTSPMSAPISATTTSAASPSLSNMDITPQSPKDSEHLEFCQDLKKGIPELKTSVPRDPRLQIREQRKPVVVTRELLSFPSPPPPPPSMGDNANSFFPLLDPKIGSQLPNKFRDIGSMLQNPTHAVVVEGLEGLGSIPYKLHEVSASPPNYLSYIYASNYDTKLLSDPRLRKHIAQGSNTVQQLTMQSKSTMPPNIPPLSLNLLSSDIVHPISNEENLNEKDAPTLESPKSVDVKPTLQKVVDPRMRKTDPGGDPRHTPPGAVHISGMDVAPSRPPHLPVVPSPASHLPRAIADPRLAKLLHPLDPRRPRSMAERNSQRMSERKAALPKNVPTASVEDKSGHAKSEVESTFPCESAPKVELPEERNKRDTPENSSKKLDVSKNRKSSMSYSSPLNSCEDNVSNSSSGYNSYNQRPKRRMPVAPPVAEPCIPVNDSASKSPDFSVCDSPLIVNEDPETSTSLKDMFKTIDPAASPFC